MTKTNSILRKIDSCAFYLPKGKGILLFMLFYLLMPYSNAQDFDMEKRPNILLIICDQFRYDCQGTTSNLVKSPNIDHLASAGMAFTNAFTPIPTCCPARQSLFSGEWPSSHNGLWNYDITLPVTPFNEHTWSEELNKKGYHMGYVGKWHVSNQKTPIDFGYDDYISDNDYKQWRTAEKLPSPIWALDNHWFGGTDRVPLKKTHTHWLAQKTIELIKKYHKDGNPWHIVFSLKEPHLPNYPIKKFLDLYDTLEIKPWGNFSDPFVNKPYIQKQQLYNWGIEDYGWSKWKVYLKHYFAMISQADDAIGRVLSTLKEMSVDKNTIVIFTADHGDAAGSHGMIDKHYVMYDEVIRVPLIIKWPDVIVPGSTSDNFVINALDLASTIPEMAGFKFMQSKGYSLVPLLNGKSPDSWRQYVFSNYNGAQFGLYVERMIRSSRWKYIWNLTDIDELYDLKNDPWEMKNLISVPEYKDTLKFLRNELFKSLKKRHSPLINWPGKSQLLEGGKLGVNEQQYER